MAQQMKVIWKRIKQMFSSQRPEQHPAETDEGGDPPDIFLGVVRSESDNSISIGILDTPHQLIAARSFELEKEHFDRLEFLSTNTSSLASMADLAAIGEFLDTYISNPKSVQVLIEVPNVVHVAFPPEQQTPFTSIYPLPCALLDIDSIYLKIIAFLTKKGCISAISPIVADAQRTKILLARINLAGFKQRQPLYLSRNITKTFTELLLDSCPSSEHSAVVAALIARNKGQYYYWSSAGMVFSSQDLEVYMREYINSGQPATRVVCPTEAFSIWSDETTKRTDIERIPLRYAVATKKHEYLGQNDAIKAALIHVCKLWGITLCCDSIRDDAVDTKNLRVYPLESADAWIINALQSDRL